VPFPESSLNEEAGKQFMEDYSQFCETARVYTDVHAGKAPVSQPVFELDNAGAAEIEETK
jgi:hypothetical protein